MSTNAVTAGHNYAVAAPYAVSSGGGALLGANLFGVAVTTLANGEVGTFELSGIFDITCLSTDTPAVGAKLYWDNTNKRLTTTSTSNTLVAVCMVAKTSGQTTVRARLIDIVA